MNNHYFFSKRFRERVVCRSGESMKWENLRVKETNLLIFAIQGIEARKEYSKSLVIYRGGKIN